MTCDSFAPTPGGWNWPQPNDFLHAIRIGDEITVGGQQSLDPDGAVVGAGDIAIQTRRIFENMRATLERAGSSLDDLVRFNTYYLFEGDERQVTPFWEAMTRVRLEFFPDPGPAATAVRVRGLPGARLMIQIEGIAVTGETKAQRQRIMPADSWDWSIPVPLSQGWRVGTKILVGGPVSADKQGRAVARGDLARQAEIVWRFIERVVEEGGGTVADIAHVKICYRHAGDGADRFLDRIVEITSDRFTGPGPVVTAFGVELLYPGLLLEIDATAIVQGGRRAISRLDGGRWAPALYSDAIVGGGEIYLGGQMALAPDGSVLEPGNLEAQARIVIRRLGAILGEAGSSLAKLKKLNLFVATDPGEGDLDQIFQRLCSVWHQAALGVHPAMSTVWVYGLPRPGALIQADGIAEA